MKIANGVCVCLAGLVAMSAIAVAGLGLGGCTTITNADGSQTTSLDTEALEQIVTLGMQIAQLVQEIRAQEAQLEAVEDAKAADERKQKIAEAKKALLDLRATLEALRATHEGAAAE